MCLYLVGDPVLGFAACKTCFQVGQAPCLCDAIQTEYPRTVIKISFNTYLTSQAPVASFDTHGFHSQASPDSGTTSSLSQSIVVLQKTSPTTKSKVKHTCRPKQ